MSSVLFFIALFFYQQPACATNPELSQLKFCSDGIGLYHGNKYGEYDYNDVYLGGERVLVLNAKGAKIIQGERDGDMLRHVDFVPPGGKKGKSHHYLFFKSKEIPDSSGYSTHNWGERTKWDYIRGRDGSLDIPEEKRKMGDVSVQRARAALGEAALQMARAWSPDRVAESKKQLDTLMRLAPLKKRGLGAVKHEAVARKQLEIAKRLKNLSACQAIADKNLKKAAAMEKKRLKKF